MLHNGETWPVKKENELALQQQAGMKMIMWMYMYSVIVTNRFSCNVLINAFNNR